MSRTASMFLLCTIVAALAASASAAEGCPFCKGTGTVPIKRDPSFARILEEQKKLGMWCNYCAAEGLYDEDMKEGPCVHCNLPHPDSAPADITSALATHVKQWWGDHDPSHTIFIVCQDHTLSTDFDDIDLKKDAALFAKQRKQVARHTLGKDVDKGPIMSRHERAHLWMQRLLDGFKFCNDTVGIEPGKEGEVLRGSWRFNVILFKDGSNCGTLNQRLGQLYSRGEGGLTYADPGSSVSADDVALARVMHNLGHTWAERLYGGGTQKGVQGWLITGTKLNTQIYFCAGASAGVATEISGSGSWGGPKRFRESVYKMVDKEKANFAAMLAKQWEAMDVNDQMLAWSLIDFLSNNSKAKFRKLLEGLVVQQQSLADALRASHGWTEGMLESSWIQYVQQNYKGDERKTLPVRGYEP